MVKYKIGALDLAPKPTSLWCSLSLVVTKKLLSNFNQLSRKETDLTCIHDFLKYFISRNMAG